MKKYNTKKLKKIHLFPLLFVLFIVIITVGVAIALITEGLFYNLTMGKISQGYKLAQGFYSQMKEYDVNDSTAMEEGFRQYENVVTDVKGITVKNEDTVICTVGEGMTNQITDIETYMSFVDESGESDDYRLYLDTTTNSCFELFRTGNFAFLEKVMQDTFLAENEDEIHNINDYLIRPVFPQACYYGFKNEDGTFTYITVMIYITLQDIMVVSLVGVSMFLICFIYFVFVIYMLIKFVRNQSRLLKLYYADKETGGRNWYYFLEKAAKKMKRYRRKGTNAAVVHIRMEKYRSYCSCYGDKEGRQLVSDFYDVIRKYLTKKEVFARHEMCDFGMLLCYDSQEQLLERIRNLMDCMDEQRPDITLYFKAGVNILDEELIDPAESYNRATTARNKIEESNTEMIGIFTQQMKEDLLWERKVENEMEKALLNHEYKVYLQPKYSVGDEKLAAAEALVRWLHPTEGLIPPYKFIPIFERNGFITKLDDYMIAEVAKLQANWIAQGKRIVPISVNVSRAHFTREDLAEHICSIVDSYKVPREVIELELTESAFFDDKQTLIGIVNKMKACGFSVSMDDFGAGYSSLNSLKDLPIDVVKLDAEFFRGNDTAGKGKVIVSEAISLAKKLNMGIVAEGIETREQVDFLAEHDCDLIQGYYFAKPMPVEEFETKVEKDGVDFC
ncbi:MAG: putative bifunctional diguanylate cyclase/phosphodiesterase [Lachnospiraceae bacterium]